MALPKSVSGSTYWKMHRLLMQAVSTANGSDDVGMPRLSNGEAAAVLKAWRWASTRSKQPWQGWYELTLTALGWSKPGDRFVMTPEHARAPYPAPEAVWNWTAAIARDLDDSKTVVRALPLDWTMQSYREAAHDAWLRMQADKGQALPLPPIPKEPPKVPPELTPPPVSGRGAFPWWLLLIVIGAAVSR